MEPEENAIALDPEDAPDLTGPLIEFEPVSQEVLDNYDPYNRDDLRTTALTDEDIELLKELEDDPTETVLEVRNTDKEP